MSVNEKKHKTNISPKKKRIYKILLIILGVLIVVRLILPYVVLHFANKTLSSIPGYYGHVENIGIALIRGAYKLDNIYINKVDSATNQQTPFFRSDVIDLSLEWKALFHGSIVGKVLFQKPELRFTKGKVEPGQVKKDSSDFRIVLKKFMPLRINRLEIDHGIIAYRDSTSKPPIALNMTETYLLAQNLRNSYNKAEILPATIKATANLYQGHLTFNMKLNPLAKQPTFDMNTELVNTNLVDFNNFFKAYGKFDVSRGNFGLYSEMAAAEGKFDGYVKPIIKDLKVIGPQTKNDGFMMQVWDHIVGGVGVVLRNQPHDQIATKIPIRGAFDDPNVKTFDAILGVLKNAFIQALMPSIDHEITLSSAINQPVEKKSFLQKIFGKKSSDKKTSQ